MIAEAVTEMLVVEARSEEDIEADLSVPRDEAEVSVDADVVVPRMECFRLAIQAKTKSDDQWSLNDIKSVMNDSTELAGRRGPPRRARPIRMLAGDPSLRYVLVTDAAVSRELRVLKADSLIERSGATTVPFSLAVEFADQTASLAPRITICEKLDEEKLTGRINGLLRSVAHVPMAHHEACLRDLRDAARDRVLGNHSARWRHSDLWTLLEKHGGSRGEIRGYGEYVPPATFSAVWNLLEHRHAVVIAGPAGTGKTFTGNILEQRLRGGETAYDVVGIQDGVASIERHLASPHPVLFHLRDPWGGTKANEHGPWTPELLKALPRASADKKFIITTRTEILGVAAQPSAAAFAPFIVHIEAEDYDDAAREQIFDNHMAPLADHERRFATKHRRKALEALRRPYEIFRFMVTIRKTGKPLPSINDVIESSRMDAIADVVAKEILDWGHDGPACAAVLWGLLQSRQRIPCASVQSIRRCLKPRRSLDLDAFVDFLLAGQHLRRQDDMLEFYHPEVDDGMQRVMETKRAEAEDILEALCNVLLQGAIVDNHRAAIDIIDSFAVRRLFEIRIAPASQIVLDEALAASVTSDTPDSTHWAFSRLAGLASPNFRPAVLVRALGDSDAEAIWIAGTWRTLSPDRVKELACIARDYPMLMRNYVRDVVPATNVIYGAEFVDAVFRMVDEAPTMFLESLHRIARRGAYSSNVSAIVSGACSGVDPRLDDVLTVVLKFAARADARWDAEYRADFEPSSEHELDAYYADYVIRTSGTIWDYAREALEAFIGIVRTSPGYRWIVNHRKLSSLVDAWSSVLEDAERVTADELTALAAVTSIQSNAALWRAIAGNWTERLGTLLEATFVRDDLTSGVRRALLRIMARRTEGDDWYERALSGLLQRCSAVRQLEVLVDLLSFESQFPRAHADADVTAALRLAASCDAAVRATMTAVVSSLIRGPASRRVLTQDERTKVGALLARSRADVLRALIVGAARAGADVSLAARAALDGNHTRAGVEAIRALAVSAMPESVAMIDGARSHSYYAIRREALTSLVRREDVDRGAIVHMAADRSAPVRQAFAEEMVRAQWPEAIPALLTMLVDRRDFSEEAPSGDSTPQYDVALAAARALAGYASLSHEDVLALLEFARADEGDPRVAVAAIGIVARYAFPVVDEVLEQVASDRRATGRHDDAQIQAAAERVLRERAVNTQ